MNLPGGGKEAGDGGFEPIQGFVFARVKVVGPTLLTGAKPGFLGGTWVGVEPHIFSFRLPRSAGWQTVDSGGMDSGDELAIHLGIALEDGLPHLLLGQTHRI